MEEVRSPNLSSDNKDILEAYGFTQPKNEPLTSLGDEASSVCQRIDESDVCQRIDESDVCQRIDESDVCQRIDESNECQRYNESNESNDYKSINESKTYKSVDVSNIYRRVEGASAIMHVPSMIWWPHYSHENNTCVMPESEPAWGSVCRDNAMMASHARDDAMCRYKEKRRHRQ